MKHKKVIVIAILGVLLVGGGTVLVLNQPKSVQTAEQSTILVVSESVTSTVKESAKDEKVPETTETVKVEETTTTVATPTEKPTDESSQPVNQAVALEHPTPSTPQANPTPAPQPQTTQRPVETTRQTTRQTTQVTTKKYRISSLGNSGREFATADEAEDWADKEQPKVKRGYIIDVVFYSDGSQTFTVDWYR